MENETVLFKVVKPDDRRGMDPHRPLIFRCLECQTDHKSIELDAHIKVKHNQAKAYKIERGYEEMVDAS